MLTTRHNLRPLSLLVALSLGVASAQTLAASSNPLQSGSTPSAENDLRLAGEAYAAGDFAQSLVAARRAARNEPNRGNAATARALAAMEAWSGAEAAAANAFEADSSPENALLLAWILRKQDRHADAVLVLEAVIGKGRGQASLSRELALLLLQSGKPEAALKALQSGADDSPTSADARLMGLILAAIPARRADAITLLRTATATATADRQDRGASADRAIVPMQLLHSELGTLLLASDDLEDAASHLQQAYDLGPQTADLAYRLAQAYRQLDQTEDAQVLLEDFQRLRAQEDERDAATRATGAALNEVQELAASNQLEAALNAVDQILAEHPTSFSGHALRGKILFSLSQVDAALDSIRRARTLRPGLVEFHYLEGLFARTIGLNQQARLALEQALALEPDLAEAHAILGGILLEDGAPNQSLWHLDRAIALGANGQQIERARATAAERAGRNPE